MKVVYNTINFITKPQTMANAAHVPLLSRNEPVDGFFVFKLNSAIFQNTHKD